MFQDAARIAFGKGVRCVAVPEVRVLEVKRSIRTNKIGKVDSLLVHVKDDKAIDFAALKVQAVYISGHSIHPAFDKYLKTNVLDESATRRPDFRSSAQKRLMPQLGLKVPIFRRWGKRFFVAVDSTFFKELPVMQGQSPGNSEVTWLVYDFERQREGGYAMQPPIVAHTTWDGVQQAMREGRAPEKQELLEQLTTDARNYKAFTT